MSELIPRLSILDLLFQLHVVSVVTSKARLSPLGSSALNVTLPSMAQGFASGDEVVVVSIRFLKLVQEVSEALRRNEGVDAMVACNKRAAEASGLGT